MVFPVIIPELFVKIRLQIDYDRNLSKGQFPGNMANAQTFIHVSVNDIRLKSPDHPSAQKNQFYVQPEFSPRKAGGRSFVPADFLESFDIQTADVIARKICADF